MTITSGSSEAPLLNKGFGSRPRASPAAPKVLLTRESFLVPMACEALSRTAMIEAGDRVLCIVSALRDRAGSLFHAVMLSQRECVSCGACVLDMVRDGWCRCRACGEEFDPTLQFQCCPDCDAALVLKRSHYWCPECRHPVRSRFRFDEAVFDPGYFREMMRESRERKREEIERIREMLATSRSTTYFPEEPPVPDDPEGMEMTLSRFLALSIDTGTADAFEMPLFDIELYRRHIQELVPGCVVDFEGVSALLDDVRLDRVLRFIAVVFMDHAGELRIEQEQGGRITLVGT